MCAAMLLLSQGLQAQDNLQQQETVPLLADTLVPATPAAGPAAKATDTPALPPRRITLWDNSPRPDAKRLAVLGASTGVALVSSFMYVNKAWWADRKMKFHFDTGDDLLYAKNIDKLGHFYGGILYADLFGRGLEWAGIRHGDAKFYGAFFGIAIQVFVEVKDAYSWHWGFSPFDVAAGSLGSFYPYFQTKSKFLAATDVKLSYWQHDRYYYQVHPHVTWNDDYMNQTYWFSFSPRRFNNNLKWPKWLAIAAGFGVDNRLSGYYRGVNEGYYKGEGRYETYLALDIDFKGLLPKGKVWQTVAHFLNYVKVPLPTLRFTPGLKAYPIFF
jgi:hypothetical protein